MALSTTEIEIYNAGERLIPGVTHDDAETVRHRSSYRFFRLIIERDARADRVKPPIRILDFGCGVGHGTAMLAEIPGAFVVGSDVSLACILYARAHYPRPNAEYRLVSPDYAFEMPDYDYVVSRGVIEHIPDGLTVAVNTRWTNRLLFNVPYNEPPGNTHHLLLGITERDFAGFPTAELYFEGLDGTTYDAGSKPPAPNMITCICSGPELPPVSEFDLAFPLPAWPHPCA